MIEHLGPVTWHIVEQQGRIGQRRFVLAGGGVRYVVVRTRAHAQVELQDAGEGSVDSAAARATVLAWIARRAARLPRVEVRSTTGALVLQGPDVASALRALFGDRAAARMAD